MRYSVPDALAVFHARYAGASDRVFGPGLTEDGRASYDVLAQTVPDDAARVLDLACGDGPMFPRLARAGRLVTALDRSPEELAAAGRRGVPGVALHEGLVQAMPFPDSSFDAATCHMAFMLFEQPEAVVGELHRVLRPGASFAAIVGRALPRSPLTADFFAALREAEAMDDLSIDWNVSHGTETGMLELFADWKPVWTPLVLTVRVPRAQVFSTLQVCYYSAGLLGEAATRCFEARVAALLDEHQVGDALALPLGMGMLQGVRPV